jgi:adenylate cyclase
MRSPGGALGIARWDNRRMAGAEAPDSRRGLVVRARIRLRYALTAANVAGALVVFVFASFVLPAPTIRHPTFNLVLNVSVFVVLGVTSVPLVALRLDRLWASRLTWAMAGREPSQLERELTLRAPLSIQAVIGTTWALAAILFGALNAPFSGELAGNVAVAVVLGGLVTCALGYLLVERLGRPIAALALATGAPGRPQLPGVAARTLLSWTLGTGVVLFGLMLIGVGGLHEKRFTAERLSVAIVALSAIGIVVGLAAMVGLARSLADRIEALWRAVGRVEQGDLDQHVEVDDASEVGLLQAGFNRMVSGLREREQLRDLFGRQVGEDVVRHALEHGVKLGGEARDAAVLFVDLCGSTTLAETRDPAEVVSLLNAFFAIVVEVVAAHEGWVNKFEGDAVVCVFGVPLPDRQAASHALAAARALHNRLADELDGMKAGIGVSAGRMVAGNLGAARRFEYTVIGDPVNEAARLSELAKGRPECVLASGAAVSRANEEESRRWQTDGEVSLRGRSSATSIAVPTPHAALMARDGQ